MAFKAIITQVGDITPLLTRAYKYNIVDGDTVLLADQSVDVKPSDAAAEIKLKLDAFVTQYEVAEPTIGTEIE